MYKNLIRFAFLFALLFYETLPVNAAEKYVIGYYRSWHKRAYPHTAVPWQYLTHIAHAFISPEKDGSLSMDANFIYPELVRTAHENGVKVVVSIGGWGNDKGFIPMVSDPKARKNFGKQLVNFCRENGYDGADLDWEYPGAEERDNFCLMVSELRSEFKKNDIEYLSAALPAKDWRNGYDIDVLRENLDWFGIMTYDFHGSWSDHAGHNSPLYPSPKDSCGSTFDSVEFWVETRDMPREKLCIGIPFYGRSFNASELFAKGSGGGSVTYAEAMNKLPQNWQYLWDEASHAAYLQNPEKTQIISFEDTRSLKEKCEYLRKEKLGGVIIWALGHDDAGTTQPLISTLGKEFLSKGSWKN
ncbi:glycoside hydrolase family 18 protein [Candidatus Sumerlaeota bacterium]|nr:glycoside hydrolase family 18 protein [Candidatus Sumerlaeota bacterium]